MFRYLSLVVSLSLPLLVGCGGSQTGGGNNGGGNGQTSPPPVTSFAESWHFASTPNSSSIEAALTLSSNSVVGVGHFQSFVTTSPCPTLDDNFPLSGTIDGQGNFSVKSSPVSGLVLFLSGVFATDQASVSSGSYHFTGGCAAEETGTLNGVKVKPLTGLFTGTMQGSGKTSTFLLSSPKPLHQIKMVCFRSQAQLPWRTCATRLSLSMGLRLLGKPFVCTQTPAPVLKVSPVWRIRKLSRLNSMITFIWMIASRVLTA